MTDHLYNDDRGWGSIRDREEERWREGASEIEKQNGRERECDRDIKIEETGRKRERGRLTQDTELRGQGDKSPRVRCVISNTRGCLLSDNKGCKSEGQRKV